MELPQPRFSQSSPIARAAVLCVVACLFFAGANALGKAAQTMLPGPELHPLQVAAARFVFGFLTVSPLLLVQGRAVLKTEIPFRHLQRVLLGFSGVLLGFWALKTMALADAISIMWSAPLFALVFAAWFLREHVGARRWLAAAIGFAGVIVLMRPGDGALQPAAMLVLAAALVTGAEVATIRVLATRDSAATILLLNNAFGAVIATLLAAPFLVVPSLEQGLALAGVGVVMVSGQAIFLQSLKLAEASQIAPFYYATIVWAALIGVFAFGETLDWGFWLGAGLIAVGGLAVTRGQPAPAADQAAKSRITA